MHRVVNLASGGVPVLQKGQKMTLPPNHVRRASTRRRAEAVNACSKTEWKWHFKMLTAERPPAQAYPEQSLDLATRFMDKLGVKMGHQSRDLGRGRCRAIESEYIRAAKPVIL
jgi:hypothetical protein